MTEELGGQGEAIGGVNEVAGSEISSNSGTPAEVKPFAVPAEYAEKPYTKDIKSEADLWKKFDGSQSLLGKPKEGGVPDVNADDAAWDAYYKAGGRPETAAEYKFNREGLDQEFVKGFANDDLDNATKEIFLEAGVSQKQADILQPKFEKMMEGLHAEQAQEGLQENIDFDKLAADTFGVDEAQVMADSKALIAENAPAGFEEQIKSLPNESLIIMAGVLNNIKSKYINEDSLDPNRKSVSGASTEDGLRKEAIALMQSDDYVNSFSPNHDKVVKEVADIYEKISMFS